MIGPVVIRQNGTPRRMLLARVLAHLNGEIDLVEETRAERKRESCREYYARHADTLRAKNADNRKAQYATDPDYRERRRAYERAYRKNRAATDPTYRERVNARNRAAWAAKKAAKKAATA